MAETELNVRIEHAYKTESEWSSSNPVLKAGEVGYVNDSNNPNYGRYKVGDGTKHWNELSYADKGIYDKVDGIEIGGRNYITNSDDLTKFNKESGVTVVQDGDYYKVSTGSRTSSRWGIYLDIPVEPNTTYSFSAYVKPGSKSASLGGGPGTSWGSTFGTYSKECRPVHIINTGENSNWRIYLNIFPTEQDDYAYFKLPKLEKGNKATDWTPAPEDKANVSHTHSASDITSGTLSSSRLPTVPVPKGGTGLTSLTSGQALIGNGTGNVTTRAIDTTSGGTSGSTSLITSGAVYAGLSGKANSSHTHSYLPLSGGTLSGDLKFSGMPSLYWNDGTYHQKIKITDDASSDTAVFSFQQSTDNGSNFTDLMVIRDNGKVIANTFVGALSGNATTASTASKVANDLTISLNGTSQGAWNGSAAKSINITPSSIGASASGHTHDDRYFTESEINSKLSAYLPLSGGTITGTLTLNGTVPYVGTDKYIAYPGGGQFSTTTSSYTGYLKITLPVSWTNTMMKFKVSIYNYQTGTSVDYYIGGYNYSSSSEWCETYATCIGKSGGKLSNLPVSFGHDGTKCAITIGNSNTVWNYPQVTISDVTVGISNTSYSTWKSGWAIEFITSALSTVNSTIENTHVGYNASTNFVRDINSGSTTTFAYSKAGLNYADYTWLAGWNGYELRAVNKSQFAQASHTHNYAGSSSAGGAASSLSGFTNTATIATAIDSATQNGHVYVNGTSGIYSQSDGAAFVQAYSTSWVAQIYQDYRTGQIALRGKNNGTWQSWRKVLDSENYTSYVPTKTGSGASGTWGISVSGNAATSTKLATARSISLGTGVSSTATNFDGSANITIPVTGIKESYLTWGGKNFSGSYGCIDAAMIPDLGANRLAFGKPAGITIEYSRDAGATWTDYGASDSAKTNLLGNGGSSFLIGKARSDNKATADYMLRITLDSDKIPVYTSLNKFALYVSTNGSTGSYCTIEASLESTPTTFVTFANQVSISGWPGWNIINTNSLTTYGNSASNQYGLIRFTFGCTGGSTTYNGLSVIRIMAFGGVGWSTPSNMAKNGHLYTYDSAQNATFPGTVKASGFDGNASTATALTTSAGTATNPIYFSSGKPVACTYTLNKSVPSDAVFTDTHYTSHLYVGASGGNANATSAISNPYLLCVDNTTNRNSIQLKAGSNMSISAVNGVITFTSSYTNTTYSAGTGLSLSGTTFNHSNSVTAGTAQGDANKTLSFGGTFTIPTVTYDAQGHITGKGTTTMTMPANPNTDTKVIQTAVTASGYTNWRPLIIGASNSGTEGFTPTTTTDGVYSVNTLSCQPSSGTIKATTFKGALSGNASTATKATQDSAGQQINTTYIKGLSVSGKTITYTKGDGGTGTITTQDTVYTHPTTAGNKHIPSGGSSGQILRWSADGTAVWGAGLPSPTESDNGKLLSVENGAYSLVSIINSEGVQY